MSDLSMVDIHVASELLRSRGIAYNAVTEVEPATGKTFGYVHYEVAEVLMRTSFTQADWSAAFQGRERLLLSEFVRFASAVRDLMTEYGPSCSQGRGIDLRTWADELLQKAEDHQ